MARLLAPATAGTRQALKDAPILVTGATGLIGRHLIRALADCGAEPWAVVRPGRESLVPPDVPSVTWDLRCDLPRTRLPRQLDAIVHLAAPRNRRPSGFGSFARHVRMTVDAAARLYDLAQERGVRHIVAVSTVAAAGPTPRRRRPVRAPAFEVPLTHPYAVVKRWGEELAVRARSVVRHVTIVRPGPVYGPGQSRHGLLARFALQLARGETIRLAAPRGRLVSPVHVGDVAYVLVAALARPSGATLTVGGPGAHRERTLVDDLARWLGVAARVRADPHERPVSFAIDNRALDRWLPERPRTRWQTGLRMTWRGRRSRPGSPCR